MASPWQLGMDERLGQVFSAIIQAVLAGTCVIGPEPVTCECHGGVDQETTPGKDRLQSNHTPLWFGRAAHHEWLRHLLRSTS